jgi:hypothetical protein
MSAPYNPLAKVNLGRSVADALLVSPPIDLAHVPELIGAGVYALYYTGSFEPYLPVAERNRNGLFGQPIYVGKAVPKGARKGGLSFDASTGRALRDRLRQHAGSISEAINLDLEDFYFRSLVVDDIWIPLGENMMIEQFKPIWNLVIDGFGNKDPGERRRNQFRSPWDIVHPGRRFVEKLGTGGPTLGILTTRLRRYFEGKPIPLVPASEAVDVGAADEVEDA